MTTIETKAEAAARAALPPSHPLARPITGPSRDEVLAMRRQYLTPA